MTWVMSMIRNSEMYISRSAPVKPGATMSTVASAKTKRMIEATPMTPTAPVRMVRANRSASFVSRPRSRTKIGMNGAARPASTRTSNRSSGRRNAATNASSSLPAPNSRANVRSRRSPMT